MVDVDFEFMGKFADLNEEARKRYMMICNDVLKSADYLLDGSDFEVCIIFADNDVIQEINKEYRAWTSLRMYCLFPSLICVTEKDILTKNFFVRKQARLFWAILLYLWTRLASRQKSMGTIKSGKLRF
jgi:hypothetical protein